MNGEILVLKDEIQVSLVILNPPRHSCCFDLTSLAYYTIGLILSGCGLREVGKVMTIPPPPPPPFLSTPRGLEIRSFNQKIQVQSIKPEPHLDGIQQYGLQVGALSMGQTGPGLHSQQAF